MSLDFEGTTILSARRNGVVALGGLWLALYIFGASDKKFQRETVSRAFSLEPGQSLDDLETAPSDQAGPRGE